MYYVMLEVKTKRRDDDILFLQFWYLVTFSPRHDFGFLFTPGWFFSLSVAENQHFKFRVVQPPILIEVAPLINITSQT